MFGINFLSPLFLAGALAIGIPIALHLFRRRTDVVIDFPAVRLMRQSPIEQQRKRRLREFLLLALRVAALLLLALSFARPYFGADASGIAAPVTVVALDTSLSMSAPGQWARAVTQAREAVTEAPATHLVGLMTFSDGATVVVPPGTDRGGVLAAIGALRPSPGGTRYRSALARAAELVPAAGRIVVITDNQQAGWETVAQGGVREGIDVVLRAVPVVESNVAVTRAERTGTDIAATVHNFGQRTIRVTARLEVDGREAGTQAVDLPPQTAVPVRFSGTWPSSGTAIVAVDDDAGYEADNRRFVVLDSPTPVPVAIVTRAGNVRDGLYLENALSVAQGNTSFQPAAVDGRELSSWPESRIVQQGLIVLLGTSSLERQGRDAVRRYLDGGGRVLLALGTGVDVATLKDVIGVDLGPSPSPVDVAGADATLVATDVRHPIFRPFLGPSSTVGDVHVARYRRLKDQDGEVLARYSDGALALVERPVGRGRLLVFTSDLQNEWNRFPLSPAFVPFAIETARYLTRDRGERQAWTLPERPPTVPEQAGVFEMHGERGTRRVAVNFDPRESNPTPATAEAFAANVPRVTGVAPEAAPPEAAAQEEQQRLWQVGLVLMLIALAGEGLVGRKAI